MPQEFRPDAEDFKGQQLPYPAKQSDMEPQPDSDLSNYRPAAKLEGKIGGWDAIFYTLSQFIGAMIAPLLLLAAIGAPFAHEDVKFATSMPGPAGAMIAFIAEFLMSFILMLAVLVALNSKRLAKLTPVIVGALIGLYIAFESPLSGMSLNPARSFGSALTADKWNGLWVYFVAPVLAMLLATEAYRLMRKRSLRLVTADYEPGPDYPVAKLEIRS